MSIKKNYAGFLNTGQKTIPAKGDPIIIWSAYSPTQLNLNFQYEVQQQLRCVHLSLGF